MEKYQRIIKQVINTREFLQAIMTILIYFLINLNYFHAMILILQFVKFDIKSVLPWDTQSSNNFRFNLRAFFLHFRV